MTFRSAFALTLAALALSLPVFPADKAAKQAEVKKAVAASLEKFYKIQPNIKGDVAKAPGYAVFTSYGLSFLLGGSGGSGLAHDAKANKDTFMSMAQATAGIQAGVQERDVLIVFKNEKALANFINKGWEFSGSGAAGAGAGGKSVGSGGGEQYVNDATLYSLTKNGLEIGAGFAGSKFWKDKELN